MGMTGDPWKYSKFGNELLIYSQTSMVSPSEFGNEKNDSFFFFMFDAIIYLYWD